MVTYSSSGTAVQQQVIRNRTNPFHKTKLIEVSFREGERARANHNNRKKKIIFISRKRRVTSPPKIEKRERVQKEKGVNDN